MVGDGSSSGAGGVVVGVWGWGETLEGQGISRIHLQNVR